MSQRENSKNHFGFESLWHLYRCPYMASFDVGHTYTSTCVAVWSSNNCNATVRERQRWYWEWQWQWDGTDSSWDSVIVKNTDSGCPHELQMTSSSERREQRAEDTLQWCTWHLVGCLSCSPTVSVSHTYTPTHCVAVWSMQSINQSIICYGAPIWRSGAPDNQK